jgi:hypoxanthine phosphoribosyltransferase
MSSAPVVTERLVDFKMIGQRILRKELLISKETIQERVNELASQISSDYNGNEAVVIGILNGAIFFVEDIVDTGLTLNHILNHLKEKNPQSIRVCALIDKLERREAEVSLHYSGFQIEAGFIVGYGLDFDEQYRYLPEIYVLS